MISSSSALGRQASRSQMADQTRSGSSTSTSDEADRLTATLSSATVRCASG